MKHLKRFELWLAAAILCILLMFVFQHFDKLADQKEKALRGKQKSEEIYLYKGPRAPLTSPVPLPVRTNWRDIGLQIGAICGAIMSVINLTGKIFGWFKKIRISRRRVLELSSYGPAAPEQIAGKEVYEPTRKS